MQHPDSQPFSFSRHGLTIVSSTGRVRPIAGRKMGRVQPEVTISLTCYTMILRKTIAVTICNTATGIHLHLPHNICLRDSFGFSLRQRIVQDFS